jgi:hypothetical protein
MTREMKPSPSSYTTSTITTTTIIDELTQFEAFGLVMSLFLQSHVASPATASPHRCRAFCIVTSFSSHSLSLSLFLFLHQRTTFRHHCYYYYYYYCGSILPSRTGRITGTTRRQRAKYPFCGRMASGYVAKRNKRNGWPSHKSLTRSVRAWWVRWYPPGTLTQPRPCHVKHENKCRWKLLLFSSHSALGPRSCSRISSLLLSPCCNSPESQICPSNHIFTKLYFVIRYVKRRPCY